MKFFRLDLLTLLISLFILSSCKKQGTVNLGVNSDNLIEGKLIDTSSIFISTVREEDAPASGLTKTPLSYFKDPLFGVTESNVAMDLNLPSNAISYTLPTGTITIDSAVLVLPYASGFYGDSITTRFKANVYQLNERLLGDSYAASKKWKRKSTLLGTRSFFSRTRDSITVLEPRRNAKDSLQKFAPQLRIPIDPQFIKDNLFDAPASLSSNLIFKNTVNGLYVTLDKAQTGPGGTFMLSMDSAAVKVYFKVKTTTDGVDKIDTTYINLPSFRHAAEISHDYSGTVIATELANTQKNRNSFYLQGLLGLRAKIQFPYLKEIVAKVGSDIIVNRAELVISVQPGTTIPYEPLNSLMLYRLDLAKQRVNIQDNSTTDPRSSSSFGGFYNRSKKEYHFLVTAYVQDLMRGKVVDYGAYLGAANNLGVEYYADVTPNPQLDGRTAAVGFDKDSPYRIKLNIIYTKISK